VLLLFGMKLLATSLTLGSGASGGVFSPALFIGATCGSAYGMILNGFFPGFAISTPAFAVAGMAGLVGGSTGAAMAAIVMIFEMTLDYSVILPMTIVVAISYGVRKVLSQDSIYTRKLNLRGHYLPEALRASPHFVKRAREMMITRCGKLRATDRPGALAEAAESQPELSHFLVEGENGMVGFIDPEIALKVLPPNRAADELGQIAGRDFIVVSEKATLDEIVTRLHVARASIALVSDVSGTLRADNVKGVITKQCIADAMVEAAELYLY
jgi:CIC family chloride channel protein